MLSASYFTDLILSGLPAAVIIRSNASTITEQEISDMVKTEFADSRKLRGGVYLADSLPLSASG